MFCPAAVVSALMDSMALSHFSLPLLTLPSLPLCYCTCTVLHLHPLGFFSWSISINFSPHPTPLLSSPLLSQASTNRRVGFAPDVRCILRLCPLLTPPAVAFVSSCFFFPSAVEQCVLSSLPAVFDFLSPSSPFRVVLQNPLVRCDGVRGVSAFNPPLTSRCANRPPVP